MSLPRSIAGWELVTLVELVPRLLPLEDEEISQMMERIKKRGSGHSHRRHGRPDRSATRRGDGTFRDGLSLNVEQIAGVGWTGFNSRGLA